MMVLGYPLHSYQQNPSFWSNQTIDGMRRASSVRIHATINAILSQRASSAQHYLTNHAKVIDKIRGHWTGLVQQREALMVC